MSISTARTIKWSDFSEYRMAEFLSKFVLTPRGCMESTGGRRAGKYLCVEMRGDAPRSQRRCLAHRAAYAMVWGVCPGDKVVRHTCDNPKCINPSHLELGTQAENVQDCVSRGRHWSQNRAKPRARR